MKILTVAFLLAVLVGSAFAKDAKTEIKISGMTCGACAVSVKSALTRVNGVKSADVSYEKGVATVVYDDEKTNEQQLRDAIRQTGFKPEGGPQMK